jgi:hypothetical protein
LKFLQPLIEAKRTNKMKLKPPYLVTWTGFVSQPLETLHAAVLLEKIVRGRRRKVSVAKTDIINADGKSMMGGS